MPRGGRLLQILLPVVCAGVGALAGGILVLVFWPQNRVDQGYFMGIATFGLGGLGLLLGYLCSLRLRGRIALMEIVAVFGVIMSAFGWLVCTKVRLVIVANAFGALFWMAVALLVVRAALPRGLREGDRCRQ